MTSELDPNTYELEPSTYTLRMWSEKTSVSRLEEYEVRAFSEEQAVQKLESGEHSGCTRVVVTEIKLLEPARPETIEIVAYKKGSFLVAVD